MRFKVVYGNHVEDGKTYVKGDVIETDIQLDTRFNNGTSVKFERLDGETDVRVIEQKDAEELLGRQGKVRKGEASKKDYLEDLTTAELKKVASKEDISLTGAHTKAEIVDALRGAADAPKPDPVKAPEKTEKK